MIWSKSCVEKNKGKAMNQIRAQLASHFSGSTVDGKNPAPVDSRSQVVPDFFHQQYLIFSMFNFPSANPGEILCSKPSRPISKAPTFNWRQSANKRHKAKQQTSTTTIESPKAIQRPETNLLWLKMGPKAIPETSQTSQLQPPTFWWSFFHPNFHHLGVS